MELHALLAEGNLAIDAGNDDRALAIIGDLVDAAPEVGAVYALAGRYFGLHRAYAQAATYFETAVGFDPSLSAVEFAVGDRVVRLRDIPGSPWAAKVLGEFASDMYKLAEQPLNAGDVVVDIGAHIGGVSVILATMHPEVRIISYEPSRSNYQMLVANLAANDIRNVTTVREAVAGARGTMELMWSAGATAGSTLFCSDAAKQVRADQGWTAELVDVVTLDDVFAAHHIGRCAWLKLDCEGAEWEICRTSGVLERVDRMSLELHLPKSRDAEGVPALMDEFARSVARLQRPPFTVVASSVWSLDS